MMKELLEFYNISEYNQTMDTVNEEKRRQIMAAVHSKDTRAEILVRQYIWSHGIRYRVHAENLPGKPDIVIPRDKLAIFVHGCFWHGHEGCSRGRLPKSKLEYWKPKIEANKTRDRLIEKELQKKNWRYLVVWECQLRTRKAALVTLPRVLHRILSLRSAKV